MDDSSHSTNYTIEGFYLLLVFLIPLVWYRSCLQREKLAIVEAQQQELEASWRKVWRTDDWVAFFGLIWFSLQRKSKYTPFQSRYRKMVLKCWHEEGRSATRELVEHGIVPLAINDGGLATEQVREWNLQKGFPWFSMPLYQQAKTRAYIEFLVPGWERRPTRKFLKMLGNNGENHGVLMRDENSNRLGSQRSLPIFADHHPFKMGAQAIIEAVLPFLPDRQLVDHHHEVSHLKFFVKGRVRESMPLLKYTRWMLVRVEARHWGQLEKHQRLDYLVLKYAQVAGIERIWSSKYTVEPLDKELERCGLEFKDF